MLEAIGGLVIGLCLGLLGSGGSILTVPILVYLLEHDPKVAIAESLAIVGGIALVACVGPVIRKRIDWSSVVFFGIPAIFGTLGGVWVSQFMTGDLQLGIFAVVMLVAAILMFRSGSSPADPQSPRTRRDVILAVFEGALVGVVTGIVGVGGGFLMVPALVLLGRLPMRVAIGTSLVIITMKSIVGFLKNWDQLAGAEEEISGATIALFIGFGVVGSIVGSRLGGRLPQEQLHRLFAGFLVVVGIVILIVSGPGMITSAASSSKEGTADAAIVE